MRPGLSIRAAAALAVAVFLAAGCERPPIQTTQEGYRGLGMVDVQNPRLLSAKIAANQIPEAVPEVDPGGPKASTVYKNVPVLGDLSVAEFNRLMVAITQWVAPPDQQCNYCHVPDDLAVDKPFTKIVSRRMLEMTRAINGDWKTHVGETGVTCYTCHRGNPVPANIWFTEVQPKSPMYAGNRDGQDQPSKLVGYTSLPVGVLGDYVGGKDVIRVVGKNALPGDPGATLRQTEATYGLMMHFSQSLGVNCTACHNTRSFAAWEASNPRRVTAWHGINMVRTLNETYLGPLGPTYPPERLGPAGDPPKATCSTCHQGLAKPLLGVNMLKSYPALLPGAAPAAESPSAAAAPAVALGSVFFEVDKSAITAASAKVIADAAAKMREVADMRVALSGFADKTGNADHNLELAKQRAFAVRDALKAAGVAESRIDLKKPEFAIGGADDASRRVEINPIR